MMTREQLLALPDRELDVEVARTVMGIAGPFGYPGPPLDLEQPYSHIRSHLYPTLADANEAYRQWCGKHGYKKGYIEPDSLDWTSDLCYWQDGWGPLSLPIYSELIGDAWPVVDKILELGFYFDCGSPHLRGEFVSGWWARFSRRSLSDCRRYGASPEPPVGAPTIARAICLAAVLAKQAEAKE